MNLRLYAWRFCACAWAAQIYWMSASPKLTSNSTRSWLTELLNQWFGLRPEADTVRWIGLILRKSAHVLEYALFAFFVFHALEGLAVARGGLRRAYWCAGIAGVYALADEFHQMFVPGRSASFLDWGIDLTGVVAATVLVYHHPDRALRATRA